MTSAREHAAAGNFDTAMRLLTCQSGIKNFAPLKPLFKDVYMCSHMYLDEISVAVKKGWSESASPNVRGPPALVLRFSQLDEKLNVAYHAMIEGKFPEALHLFLSILHAVPLIVVDSRREVNKVKELIEIAKEYALGLKIEVRRKETRDDVVRHQELAPYFTNCKLQKVHARLALMSAMTVCYRGGNYAMSGNFARMLIKRFTHELDLDDQASIRLWVEKSRKYVFFY